MAAHLDETAETIFENENFQEEITNGLNEVISVRNHDFKKIWKAMFRAVNNSVVEGRTDLRIDELLGQLRITSEKIFEYKNFRAEFANGLEFDVSNEELEGIWEVVSRTVNNSALPSLEDFKTKLKQISRNKNFREETKTRLQQLGYEGSDDANSEKNWKVFHRAVDSSLFAGRMDLQIVSLLENLKLKSKQIFEDETVRKGIETGLQQLGYEGYNEDDSEGSHENSSESTWKLLSLAVNSSLSIGRYVNLAGKNFEQTKKQLEELLLTGKKKSLKDCLGKKFRHELASKLKSPKDIAEKSILGIKSGAPIYFVTNLIEQQFSIRWNTDNVNGVGEPDEFNFYTFCDVDAENCRANNKKRYLKYDPRRAHVKVQLYRLCKTGRRTENSPKRLCPHVYIRHGEGWKEWDPAEEIFKPNLVREFNWMNRDIYQCIRSQAIEIEENDHEQALTKPTLYWAVVDDTDFKPGDHLKLKDIGKTQVYVGKANNGVKGRWIRDSDSHCKMMKKCLDNVQEMTRYEPLRLKGIQLVDARILLAKLKGSENCALFVMKTYGESEIESELKEDEKAHIDGKQRRRKKKVNLLKRPQGWKPKDMAYGMNSGH